MLNLVNSFFSMFRMPPGEELAREIKKLEAALQKYQEIEDGAAHGGRQCGSGHTPGKPPHPKPMPQPMPQHGCIPQPSHDCTPPPPANQCGGKDKPTMPPTPPCGTPAPQPAPDSGCTPRSSCEPQPQGKKGRCKPAEPMKWSAMPGADLAGHLLGNQESMRRGDKHHALAALKRQLQDCSAAYCVWRQFADDIKDGTATAAQKDNLLRYLQA